MRDRLPYTGGVQTLIEWPLAARKGVPKRQPSDCLQYAPTAGMGRDVKRGLERRGVADLEEDEVAPIVRLARSIGAPASSFVEPASFQIGVEDPQRRCLEAGCLEARLRCIHELAPAATAPRVRRDVDSRHLARGRGKVVIPRRRDVNEADHLQPVLEDEGTGTRKVTLGENPTPDLASPLDEQASR